MTVDFRCPSCNAKLATVDEAAPYVAVLCRNCKAERVYRPVSDPRHWEYARFAEPAGRQTR